MKSRIYSYALPELPGPFALRLPIGGKLLAVFLCKIERPKLSVLVVPDRDLVVRCFLAEWMGQDTEATVHDRFLGVVQLVGGPSLHYFERCNRKLGVGPCQCEPPCPH